MCLFICAIGNAERINQKLVLLVTYRLVTEQYRKDGKCEQNKVNGV